MGDEGAGQAECVARVCELELGGRDVGLSVVSGYAAAESEEQYEIYVGCSFFRLFLSCLPFTLSSGPALGQHLGTGFFYDADIHGCNADTGIRIIGIVCGISWCIINSGHRHGVTGTDVEKKGTRFMMRGIDAIYEEMGHRVHRAFILIETISYKRLWALLIYQKFEPLYILFSLALSI